MQRRFCDYLAYNQGRTTYTEAALKAGYNENRARIEGSELMKNPKIQRYYRYKVNDVNRSLAVNRTNYIQRLIKLSNKAENKEIRDNCAPLEALIGKSAGLLVNVIQHIGESDLNELREEERRLKKINEEGLETQKLLNSKE
tara:strand:- start:92 stop:517 length:426 start_codon:yes stop_codon:yes gene_type:complete